MPRPSSHGKQSRHPTETKPPASLPPISDDYRDSFFLSFFLFSSFFLFFFCGRSEQRNEIKTSCRWHRNRWIDDIVLSQSYCFRERKKGKPIKLPRDFTSASVYARKFQENFRHYEETFLSLYSIPRITGTVVYYKRNTETLVTKIPRILQSPYRTITAVERIVNRKITLYIREGTLVHQVKRWISRWYRLKNNRRERVWGAWYRHGRVRSTKSWCPASVASRPL